MQQVTDVMETKDKKVKKQKPQAHLKENINSVYFAGGADFLWSDSSSKV